jgi:hypothetical protein
LIGICFAAGAIFAKEPLPFGLVLAMGIIPLALLGLVVTVWPRLWQGFLEHAQQTPSLTGLRMPGMAEILKLVRTLPGILLAVPLLAWAWVVAKRGTALGSLPPTLLLVTVSSSLAALVIALASMFVLTPNSVFFGAYLQPVAVASCLTILSDVLPQGRCRRAVWGFLLAAALGSIRAIGLSTWGVACAADVSYSEAIASVRQRLNTLGPGERVVLSSAYLYEAARFKELQWLHSDWLARAELGRTDFDRVALIQTRPSCLILTPFDFYRRYQPVLAELQRHPELVESEIIQLAGVPPPDANPSLQKVIQHVSWAPVIVKLSWR